jgi:hypothetical protein
VSFLGGEGTLDIQDEMELAGLRGGVGGGGNPEGPGCGDTGVVSICKLQKFYLSVNGKLINIYVYISFVLF